MTESDALIELGHYLKKKNYQFTSITPESHRRVLARHKGDEQERLSADGAAAQWSRDLFGWNLKIPKSFVPEECWDLLQKTGLLIESGSLIKSSVRFSSLGDLLFVHSAFPTLEEDAVFFGPDTYRFVRFINERALPAKKVLDLCAGSGAGGLCLAQIFERRFKTRVEELYLLDINEKALNYSKINSAINAFEPAFVLKSDLLQEAPKEIDLIIANPPFMIDEFSRTYRHGGGRFGTELSVEIVRAALDHLKLQGGQLLLYTGSPIVKGLDIFFDELRPLLKNEHLEFTYEEIDPDLYGEELSKPAYAEVERIAGVGLSVLVKA